MNKPNYLPEHILGKELKREMKNSMKNSYKLLLGAQAEERLLGLYLHLPFSATLRTKIEVLESPTHKAVTTQLFSHTKRTPEITSEVSQTAV